METALEADDLLALNVTENHVSYVSLHVDRGESRDLLVGEDDGLFYQGGNGSQARAADDSDLESGSTSERKEALTSAVATSSPTCLLMLSAT